MAELLERTPEIIDALSRRYARRLPPSCVHIDCEDIRQEMLVSLLRTGYIKAAMGDVAKIVRHQRVVARHAPGWLPYHHPSRTTVISAKELIDRWAWLYEFMLMDCNLTWYAAAGHTTLNAINRRLQRIRQRLRKELDQERCHD